MWCKLIQLTPTWQRTGSFLRWIYRDTTNCIKHKEQKVIINWQNTVVWKLSSVPVDMQMKSSHIVQHNKTPEEEEPVNQKLLLTF